MGSTMRKSRGDNPFAASGFDHPSQPMGNSMGSSVRGNPFQSMAASTRGNNENPFAHGRGSEASASFLGTSSRGGNPFDQHCNGRQLSPSSREEMLAGSSLLRARAPQGEIQASDLQSWEARVHKIASAFSPLLDANGTATSSALPCRID